MSIKHKHRHWAWIHVDIFQFYVIYQIKSIKMNNDNHKKWRTFWWSEKRSSVSLFVSSVAVYLEFVVTVHWCIVRAYEFVCLFVCIDCCSWCGLKQHTLISRFWMQVVRVVYHTVHSGAKKGATKRNDRKNIDIEIMAIIRFGHVVKLRKLSIFLFCCLHSTTIFSLLFGWFWTFMKNWFSIPSKFRT